MDGWMEMEGWIPIVTYVWVYIGGTDRWDYGVVYCLLFVAGGGDGGVSRPKRIEISTSFNYDFTLSGVQCQSERRSRIGNKYIRQKVTTDKQSQKNNQSNSPPFSYQRSQPPNPPPPSHSPSSLKPTHSTSRPTTPQNRHPIHHRPLRRRRKGPVPSHEPKDPLIAHDPLEHLRQARLHQVHQLPRRRRRHLIRDRTRPVLEQLQKGRALAPPRFVAAGGADEEGEEGDVDGEGLVGVGDVGAGGGGGGG